MHELTALAKNSLGNERAWSFRIPYLFGLGARLVSDLVARLTGRRFPLSAVRVRKYHANTQFSSSRILATGFVPRHDLRDALIATIRHEFGCSQDGIQPRASGAAGLATTPSLVELMVEWEELAEQVSDRDITQAEEDAPLLERREKLQAHLDHAAASTSSRAAPTDR